MKIFLTGAGGFVGKHLIKKLADSNIPDLDLLLLSRKGSIDGLDSSLYASRGIKIQILKGDLNNSDYTSQLLAYSPDTCVHLAWEGIPDYGAESSSNNLLSSLNLIKSLLSTNCKKIICTGSLWEYASRNGKLTEQDQLDYSNPFKLAKNALASLGHELCKKKAVDFVWARLFFVYGVGQKATSLFPHLIDSIKKGKEINLRTPFAVNDFIHVNDVADALIHLLGPSRNQIYNVGSGTGTSVQQVLSMVYKELGQSYRVQSGLPNENYFADITRMNEEFNWEPKVSLEAGIKEMINYG